MSSVFCPKKSSGLLTEIMGEELLVFNSTQGTAACLDGAARLIFEACDGRNSQQDLVGILLESSQEHREMCRQSSFDLVSSTVGMLTDKGLLEPAATSLISREEFLKRWGTALVALPIMSVVLPRPAAAVSACVNHSVMSCPTNDCAPCDGADQANCADCTCLTIYCTTGTSCLNDTRLGTLCANATALTFPDTKLSCSAARAGVSTTQFVQTAGACASAASFNCSSGRIYACCQCT